MNPPVAQAWAYQLVPGGTTFLVGPAPATPVPIVLVPPAQTVGPRFSVAPTIRPEMVTPAAQRVAQQTQTPTHVLNKAPLAPQTSKTYELVVAAHAAGTLKELTHRQLSEFVRMYTPLPYSDTRKKDLIDLVVASFEKGCVSLRYAPKREGKLFNSHEVFLQKNREAARRRRKQRKLLKLETRS